MFATILICLFPPNAQARSCDNFPHDRGCPLGSKTGQGTSSAGPLVARDNPKKTLNPKGMYRIEFACKSKGPIPQPTLDQFIQTQTAASLLIAIAEQDTGSTPTPDSSKAILSVYNVGGPITNRTNFVNKACNNRPFFIPARRPLTLIAVEADIDTHTLGPFLQAIENAIKIVSSSWPIFAGQPLPSDAGKRLSAVNDTAAPIGSFVAAMDKGVTNHDPEDLTEGHTRINGRYATVDVYVTKLVSITGVDDNGQFRTDLETLVSKMVTLDGIKPATSTNADIEASCSGQAAKLERLNNFSKEDIAFSLVLAGETSGFLTKAQYIHCLGPDYASVAYDEDFVDSLTKSKQFDKNDIAIAYPGGSNSQPDFQDVRSKLGDLMSYLRTYQTLPPPPTDFGLTTLGKIGMTSDIQIVDDADVVKPDDITSGVVKAPLLMKTLKDKGFTRFGCLMRDTIGTAFFLALPEKPATDKGFQVKEALLVEAWVDSAVKLNRVRLSVEGDIIAAAVKNNSSACGPGAPFAS
jgi:hypothetical protein